MIFFNQRQRFLHHLNDLATLLTCDRVSFMRPDKFEVEHELFVELWCVFSKTLNLVEIMGTPILRSGTGRQLLALFRLGW